MHTVTASSVPLACGIVLLNCGASCQFTSACNMPVVPPGAYVRVVNDQTGEGITDAVVTVTTADRQNSETLSGGDADGNYVGGYGFTGALTVTVEAAGFAGQRLEGVVVEALPECRIVPADVTVRLIPSI